MPAVCIGRAQYIDTDAHGHAHAGHFTHAGPALKLDPLADALGELHRLGNAQAGDDDHEFFAAVATHQIGGSG